MNRTPPSYRRATWRCTLPHDPVEGVIGIGINVDGGVERYALDTRSAHALVQTLAGCLGYEIKSPAGTQSPTSPLIPNLFFGADEPSEPDAGRAVEARDAA